MEQNWQKILPEALSIIKESSNMIDDYQDLVDVGSWSKCELYNHGLMNETNCLKAPFTCSLIKPFTAASKNQGGQVS